MSERTSHERWLGWTYCDGPQTQILGKFRNQKQTLKSSTNLHGPTPCKSNMCTIEKECITFVFASGCCFDMGFVSKTRIQKAE